jgi:hypothetical protein
MRNVCFAVVVLLYAAAAQAADVLEANSANVLENEGSVTVSVQRRHAGTGTVTVDYATRSGSAVAGRDFTPVAGTLTFNPGETVHYVTIAILDNSTYDGNRTFFLDLSNPTGGATLATYPLGDVDLYDDEPPPSASIDDIRLYEGDSGTRNADFTISLTGVTRTINIKIFWSTNDYSATEGSDYASGGGTFDFTPADTQKTVSIPIFGDTTIEDDEKFYVFIYGGASFAKQYGYCTILDDDDRFTILAAGGAVIEGNDGTPMALVTLLPREQLSGIKVDYATLSGTATAGSDFPVISGTITFWGDSPRQIAIPVNGDTEFESNEQFTVHLSSADPRVTIDPQDVVITIVNDDPPVP